MKYRADGEGERVSSAQQKSARFHGLPDSEIYTTEYLPVRKRLTEYVINASSVYLYPNLSSPAPAGHIQWYCIGKEDRRGPQHVRHTCFCIYAIHSRRKRRGLS